MYVLVEDKEREELDEELIRATLAEMEDINGNKLTNEIGKAESFQGDGYENHFLCGGRDDNEIETWSHRFVFAANDRLY